MSRRLGGNGKRADRLRCHHVRVAGAPPQLLLHGGTDQRAHASSRDGATKWGKYASQRGAVLVEKVTSTNLSLAPTDCQHSGRESGVPEDLAVATVLGQGDAWRSADCGVCETRTWLL